MLALAALLSVLVGVSLGLLGGGGSILMVPILLYVVQMEERTAIATSLLVVGVTSAVAAIPHYRQGNVDLRVGLGFAAVGMIGAYLGGRAAAWISPSLLLYGFVAMMIATAVSMLRGRKEHEPSNDIVWPKLFLTAGSVGCITGLVGAGGGFMVVPALSLVGGLPLRRAVGTSLLVIALQTSAGFLGHLHGVSIDPQVTGIVLGAAVFGSIAGSLASSRVPQTNLRRAFGVLVLGMAALTLAEKLMHP